MRKYVCAWRYTFMVCGRDKTHFFSETKKRNYSFWKLMSSRLHSNFSSKLSFFIQSMLCENVIFDSSVIVNFQERKYQSVFQGREMCYLFFEYQLCFIQLIFRELTLPINCQYSKIQFELGHQISEMFNKTLISVVVV